MSPVRTHTPGKLSELGPGRITTDQLSPAWQKSAQTDPRRDKPRIFPGKQGVRLRIKYAHAGRNRRI